MTSESLKGFTEECLKHFSETHQLNTTHRSIYPIRNGIAILLGINSSTGLEWFGKFRLPMGENLLRLRYLLHLVGYELTERAGMHEAVREVADGIALRVLTLQDAAEYTTLHHDHLMGILLNKGGTSSSKVVQMAELAEMCRQDAQTKSAAWKKEIEALGLLSKSTPSTPLVTPTPQQFKTFPKPDAATTAQLGVVEMLAHLLLVAKPLAEQLLSDAYPAEDRQRLRELTRNGHTNAVFELSNMLNRLCGERARKELK